LGIDNSKPSPSQIEITLLGPGYGESILIHFGGNQWGIIDSCIAPKQKAPAALNYLRSIDVNPEEAVVIIVASHWHDDHIRGLSQIVETCKEAVFSCPSVFGKIEFASMLSRFNKNNKTATGSGVQEMWKIYNMLGNRGKCPKLAVEGKRILSISTDQTAHGKPVQFWSLSPSDHQVDLFLQEIGAQLPQRKNTKYRAVAYNPNRAAQVNLIEIGPLAILLGADLEEKGKNNLGWSTIIANRDAMLPKACVYKVAHHGSINAHHNGIWEELLSDKPFALITPWNRSNGLPTEDDIKRFTALTPNGYITSQPKATGTNVRRDPAVERMIKQITGGRLHHAEPRYGVIRLRTTDGNHNQWNIDLSDAASSLAGLAA